MHFKDLHEFIEYLETKNDLVRIERQVSSELEITEIADRMVKSGGPALLFENVIGSKFPLVISTSIKAYALNEVSINTVNIFNKFNLLSF